MAQEKQMPPSASLVFLLCSLFYNILHRLYIAFPQEVPFMKKDPAKQDSPPAAGRASDILPFRRSAIRAERFLSYGNEVSYTIKNNVPWHILAPRRGCFSNHLPLRRVRILAERFYRMETKFPIR